ncbi:hypothetical protein [Variovorax sp.]|uniref:hypothetical protein n=1 Tax=Variovorax sp. TaxID=1871043 RepID=UPI0037D9A9A3
MDPRPLIFLEKPCAEYRGDFPVRTVVVAGLTSTMDYWTALAVGWLEQGFPLDEEIVEMLRNIAQTRHFPQQLRHRSVALARRWVRQGS